MQSMPARQHSSTPACNSCQHASTPAWPKAIKVRRQSAQDARPCTQPFVRALLSSTDACTDA
eukprot:3263767-Pleurochrysis_carterae.AAC.1